MTRTRYQEGPDRSHWHDTLGVAGTPASELGLDEPAHDALNHAGLPGIPSTTGLLDEPAHDALDHAGLTGIPTLAADAKTQKTGANYTTTSTTYGDVDATNLASTITTGARRVKVMLAGGMDIATTNAIQFDIHVDDVSQGTTNGVWQFRPNSYGVVTTTCVWVSDVLTAGSHTIKLRWLVNGGTGTLYRNAFYPLVWLVEELP